MKFSRRKAERRSSGQREVQSQYERTDRRRRERRTHRRHPIHTWFVLNKKELLFYLYMLIICLLVAAMYSFKKNATDESLRTENRNYISELPEKNTNLK